MGKISDNSAHRAAHKIAAPINEKAKAAYDILNEAACNIFASRIPKEILALSLELMPWIYKVEHFKIKGRGINQSFYLKKPAPSNCEDLMPTPTEAKHMLQLIKIHESYKDEYEKTWRKIKAAILTLGTHAKVKAELPEAYDFLVNSPQQTKALALPIAPIKVLVHKLISENKETK
jgi:hypothetical protein